jgi:ribosome biogenesis GTPase A
MVQRDANLQSTITKELVEVRDEIKDVSKLYETTASELLEAIRRFESAARRAFKTQFLLESLSYSSMYMREGSIRSNHPGTFQQMYSRDSRLYRWLQDGKGLFWVSGKPGSGKSTLMKFLYEDSQTRRVLKSRAPGKTLVILRHYFWIAGSDMQKCDRGLLLSLCCDLFRGMSRSTATTC